MDGNGRSKMRLRGKKALVLGGSKGIGRAICSSFASEGADVAFTYYSSRAEAEEIRDRIILAGGRAFFMQADISKRDAVWDAVGASVSALGGLDILVLCGGIMPEAGLMEISEEELHRVLDTNLNSAFYALQAAHGALLQSAAGRVVLISSQAAFTGSMMHAHYAASKAGILGLVYTAAKEFGPSGITVNAVSPGRIETDMLNYAGQEKRDKWLSDTPLKRFGRPEEVAGAVTFLASDESSYITGTNINVNGGMLMG